MLGNLGIIVFKPLAKLGNIGGMPVRMRHHRIVSFFWHCDESKSVCIILQNVMDSQVDVFRRN
jgi:hypothetical protein